MNCMAYNSVVVSYPVINFKGFSMKNCGHCNIPFSERHSSLFCSIKCKILGNIEKNDNGCWIYKGSSSGVYGKVRWNLAWISAHRASYQQFVGEVEEGRWVCHKCDIPKCVNPEHLFIGSASDNRRDAVRKQRVPKGEDNYFSKFTDSQTQEMRLLKKEGFTYDRLSRIFNCSIVHLVNVIKNTIRR